MDDLEYAKIGGVVCAALLAFVGLGQIAKATVKVDHIKEPAYVIEIAEDEVEEEVEVVEMLPLIASADLSKGKKVFKKCSGCHEAEDGGANGQGPNLYGIVGSPVASVAGFRYSNAFPAGEAWTFDNLSAFLDSPASWAPGTKMNFKGIKKPEDRAAVIAWLNSRSAAPLAIE